MDIGKQAVDVVAAPGVAAVEVAAVLLPALVVVERRVAVGVGVEEVVEVHAVDVVALDHVEDDVADPRLHLWVAGVEVGLVGVLDEPLGILLDGVVVDQVLQVRILQAHPVGVEPGVQLQTALVGLLDRERERVVAGIAALLAGQVARPRLLVRLVKGVRGRPDMQERGVEVHVAQGVKLVDQLLLLLLGAQPGLGRPVDVAHRCDPGAAQVTLAELGVGLAVLGNGIREVRVGVTGIRVGDTPCEQRRDRRPNNSARYPPEHPTNSLKASNTTIS